MRILICDGMHESGLALLQKSDDFQVNIANMHLSRTPAHDQAIAIIRIDDEAPQEALQALRSFPNIVSVQQVKL